MAESSMQTPLQLNPLSMSVEETARMLAGAGGRRVSPEAVQSDIDNGAPLGAGGRVNLGHYMAWLIREVQSR